MRQEFGVQTVSYAVWEMHRVMMMLFKERHINNTTISETLLQAIPGSQIRIKIINAYLSSGDVDDQLVLNYMSDDSYPLFQILSTSATYYSYSNHYVDIVLPEGVYLHVAAIVTGAAKYAGIVVGYEVEPVPGRYPVFPSETERSACDPWARLMGRC